MPLIEVEQRTADWLALRCGMVTASRVADVLAVLKRSNDEAAARKLYRTELVIENLTGLTTEHFVSRDMAWGIEQEPFARAAYEMRCNMDVNEPGFAIHPTISKFGASPDGLLGTDGVLEIKCPSTAVHLDYILNGVVPIEYQPQMLAEMACAERSFCDFVSYDSRLPAKLQLFVRRFPRDDTKIAEMEKAVLKFLAEVDQTLALLQQANND